MDQDTAASRFVDWIAKQIESSATGADTRQLDVKPEGKFWLGTLTPETVIAASSLGDRAERIDPCAIGMRFISRQKSPFALEAEVSFRIWRKQEKEWQKSGPLTVRVPILIDFGTGTREFGKQEITDAVMSATGVTEISARIDVSAREMADTRVEYVVYLVNSSPAEANDVDTALYESALSLSGVQPDFYVLESLPDSFRYDRRVPAYGLNCGLLHTADGSIKTTDTVMADRFRPHFYPTYMNVPDLTFTALADSPVEKCRVLVDDIEKWGTTAWSKEALASAAQKGSWTNEMHDQAQVEAGKFMEEFDRISAGVTLLEKDGRLNLAFRQMNRAMSIAANGEFDRWRPFQVGFLLANLAVITDFKTESDIADIVWFATGGGKTETYLGLLVAAAFFDRARGKSAGITAWSRFPLRMLSLQQTQRFANALCAAELVRRQDALEGDPFSLGFLVGDGSTPNSVSVSDEKDTQWDADDPAMPARARVLDACPFCRQESIEMGFNRRLWRLEHRCTNVACPWPEEGLPIYVVDEEVYRFLPTVVVGTLDKAATIAFQAAMRGLVGFPLGMCSKAGHGFTYAPRSKKPTGCLVPGCTASVSKLPLDPEKYAPSFRLQDELHLLRDSLGAVDAHYEALFDGLQQDLVGFRPKILASSATLSGYERQTEILYRRAARVFPLPGPSASLGFWSSDSGRLMRRYVAIAPRGATVEQAVDRVLSDLQTLLRELVRDPQGVCRRAGIDSSHSQFLVDNYGVHVIYGNTLKDLDAVTRSIEGTNVDVEGSVPNVASLTGRTAFEEVRDTLRRLEEPEKEFADRIHIVAASSMMSHGVDIDRLNVMVMLGLPLGTAEFIQATARVGRRYPGLVLVIHKIGRERDASVYRSFQSFVKQGDRFVEPIPVTRRSRRVLDKTLAGMIAARILAIHEPRQPPLTTLEKLRKYKNAGLYEIDDEMEALFEYLCFDSPLDDPVKEAFDAWMTIYARNLDDPPTDARFVSDICPTGPPMRSLRDVEEPVPVIGRLL